MGDCDDFTNLKSTMEQLAEFLSEQHGVNIEVLVTMHYHCEIAGEGIKYGWDLRKRDIPIFHWPRRKEKKHFGVASKQSAAAGHC
jgi:hypothetical protein